MVAHQYLREGTDPEGVGGGGVWESELGGQGEQF
jgi:hypothetical protein